MFILRDFLKSLSGKMQPVSRDSASKQSLDNLSDHSSSIIRFNQSRKIFQISARAESEIIDLLKQ